ncbi:hypothetical protein Cpir12675_002091 [Ceratocystis pirilliformis]|uniref:PWWP domain-containing protein n=1 Tax=Ceratocystis pirilliformis TaxID=259994 RepID=A0ABR3ZCM4_9PEZI
MPSPAKTPEKEEPTAVVADATNDVKMADADDEKIEETPAASASEEKADESSDKSEDKAESEDKDTEMKDADAASGKKQKATNKAIPKKKSGGGSSGGKKKKATRTSQYLDAQPGDQFLVKLKGFPAWPAIIADEDMLPTQLLSTRPVTARRADGTYRDDYADGGKRMNDRTFPVMYLYTNEFGWVPNSILSELTAEKARETKTEKMRKDLQAAFELASEGHPIEYYKDMLQQFQEEMVAAEEAAKEAAEAKAKASLEVPDDEAPKKSKKRKAADDDSKPDAKKPKIKLNVSNPKTNGDKTKASKPKPATKKAATPKEVQMSAEERHERKEREVRFFRHRLQKSLLTRDVPPKPEDMELMDELLTKLEALPDLEVSIIRATKINKVLRAILKLDSIPRDADFNFKARANDLLGLWNKLLASETAASTSHSANGDKTEANGKSNEDNEAGDLTVMGDQTMKVYEAEGSDKADEGTAAEA